MKIPLKLFCLLFVTFVDSQDDHPLLKAIELDDLTALVHLVEQKNVDVNVYHSEGHTPLIRALELDHKFQTEYLLQQEECDVNKLHLKTGMSPLLIAIRQNSPYFVKILLDRIADVNVKSEHGNVLNYAAEYSDEIMTHLLITRGAKGLVNEFGGEYVRTPLLTALSKRTNFQEDTVKTLLANGANVFSSDSEGCSTLHYAAMYGGAEVINALVALGAGILINTVNKAGDTPFLSSLAVWGPNQTSRPNRLEVLDALLIAGARVNKSNSLTGLSSLQVALRNGLEDDIVRKIWNAGGDACHCDKEGASVLAYAIRYAPTFMWKMMMSRAVNTVNVADIYGVTPLMVSLQTKPIHIPAVEALLNSGAQILTMDCHGHTVAHHAAYYGDVKVMNLLFQKEPLLKKTLNLRNSAGNTVLLTALVQWDEYEEQRSDRLPLVRTLVEAGADPKQTNDKTKETVLHECVRANYVSCVEYLMHHGADPKAVDIYGNTVFHVPGIWSNALVETLVRGGADPNTKNLEGETPITASLKYEFAYGKRKIYSVDGNYNMDGVIYVPLLRNMANVNEANNENDTPLHISVRHQHFIYTAIFHYAGGDPNIPNKKGETVLLSLLKGNVPANPHLVHMLIEGRGDGHCKADVGALDSEGHNALYYARRGNHAKIVQDLLDAISTEV